MPEPDKTITGIKINVNYVGAWLDIVLLTISGYVDTTTCQELAKVLRDLVKQKRYQFIVDLAGITYISSAGWGVFIGEIKNIRDKGGDLKVVQMNPDVFEVFEMLEFNRILNTYDTIEEAINEFDIIRGVDISKVQEEARQMAGHQVDGTAYQKRSVSTDSGKGKQRIIAGGKISVKDYPLNEKIKMIAVENPLWGIAEIKAQLDTEKFGNIRLGWIQIYRILRKLNLESKEKRYRFYRSR